MDAGHGVAEKKFQDYLLSAGELCKQMQKLSKGSFTMDDFEQQFSMRMTLYKMVLATFRVLFIFDVLDYAFLHYNYKYDWHRQTLEEIVDTSYNNKSNLHPYDFDSMQIKNEMAPHSCTAIVTPDNIAVVSLKERKTLIKLFRAKDIEKYTQNVAQIIKLQKK